MDGFKDWDCSKDQYCCFAYLLTCYDTISYTSGTVLYDAANYPVSPLHNFILELNGFHSELRGSEIENPDDDFTEEVFYEYRDAEEGPVILTVQDLRYSDRYPQVRLDEEGVPYYDPMEDNYRIEEAGRSYIITLDQLNYKDHSYIIETLTAPTSPYFREYQLLKAYRDKLKEQERKAEGNIFRRSPISRTA